MSTPKHMQMTTPVRLVDDLDRANYLLGRAVRMLATRDGVSEARMRLDLGIDRQPEQWAEDAP